MFEREGHIHSFRVVKLQNNTFLAVGDGDARHAQCDGQIVGQGDDLLDAHVGRWIQE